MIYTITDSFTKLSERSGTIQNSCIYPIEVSNKAQPGTGITLRPNEKISFANLTVYVRSESLKGEIRVVPFIIGTVDSSSSGGGSSSGSDDSAQEGYNADIDDGITIEKLT